MDVVISRWKNTVKKKMFGGICYLLRGNMCFGIYKDFLIIRAGEDKARESLKFPGTRPFDITGKPMKGWVMVEPALWRKPKALPGWLELGKKLALTLPPK
ncbi:TfoX/Sxy family protein [Fibrobacterota bacterium]